MELTCEKSSTKRKCFCSCWLLKLYKTYFRYDDAWKVYETMEVNNVCPDHFTCSIMITVMRKIGRSAKEAWDFFEKMNRKGVRWSPEVLVLFLNRSVTRVS